MQAVTLIFPHQLFQENASVAEGRTVILIEEFLFFKQYSFHKQKLFLHRASMQCYRQHLEKSGLDVRYIEARDEEADIRKLVKKLQKEHVREIHYVDVTDNWLQKRLATAAAGAGISLTSYATPMFINSADDIDAYFMNKKRYFQADFYTVQRKRLRILVDDKDQPEGGKWSFDAENRVKYPKKKLPPEIHFPAENECHREAKAYIEKHFKMNYGEISDTIRFPVTFAESEVWLNEFLEKRFAEFGTYEDAIVSSEHFLHHGVLTPLLNTGLLTPRDVAKKTLAFAQKKEHSHELGGRLHPADHRVEGVYPGSLRGERQP